MHVENLNYNMAALYVPIALISSSNILQHPLSNSIHTHAYHIYLHIRIRMLYTYVNVHQLHELSTSTVVNVIS